MKNIVFEMKKKLYIYIVESFRFKENIVNYQIYLVEYDSKSRGVVIYVHAIH